MKNKETIKNCGNCEYFAYDTFGRAHVCVNDKSEHVADFVFREDCCECYVERKEKETEFLGVVDLKKWLEEQKRLIEKDKDAYASSCELISLLDVVENYVEDNSIEI